MMKRTSRRLFFHEMVDFSIRKLYFGSCPEGAFWEAPERKKRLPNILTVALIGRKKSASTFLLPKKRTFGGEGGRSNLSTGYCALAKRGALACAYGALGAIYALRWVYFGLTFGTFG